MEAAVVNFDNEPDAETGWYNLKTGTVNVTFEYPEYDEVNHAPAVGIVYELTIQYEDGSETTENKSFYKGYLNNDSKNVVMVSDYHDENSLATLPTLNFDKNSISKITIYAQDAAGNKSEVTEYEIKADYIAPDNILATADGSDLKVYLDDSGDTASYVIFSQNSVSVSASAEYGISEKGSFGLELTKNQGETGTAGNGDSITIDPCNRGLVYICAIDGAGNKTEAWTDGIVVDNQAPVGTDGVEITIETEGKNAAEFYNDDVPLAISVEDAPSDDGYSGLKSVVYQVGKNADALGSEITLQDNSSLSMSWSQIESLHSFSDDSLVINAADNESNAATIIVTATDNAGNTTTTTKEIKIDVTKPVIEISYDTSDAKNNTYYNKARTAQIDITELNFDPSKVEFTIYKDGKVDNSLAPSVSLWTSSDDSLHTAYITFDQDGDYSFEVKCTDLADNESDTVESESFTIDRTNPVIKVSYDNDAASNQNYYNKERTATITVTEHNFDAKDFEAVINPTGTVVGWTNDGDDHKATIRFYDEESYSYVLNYTDLAGNAAVEYGPDQFTIDVTAPEITIEGVANHSANAGSIAPVVYVSDKNYDTEGVHFELATSKGKNIEVQSTVEATADGYKYTLTNLNGLDDAIYTLTVTATDMANNQNVEAVKYSLNRNGSVYDLSQISSLVEQGYIKYEDLSDLHITEMNVNEISEFRLYITRNNKVIEATQVGTRPISADGGIYYSVSVIGNEDTGYEYDYTIYRESFADEGHYNVMFYSMDKAGNEVNNTLDEKNAELSFVVDNTAPKVSVDYDKDAGVANLYVNEEFGLKEATFEMVDEQGNIIDSYNYLENANELGEVVTIQVSSEVIGFNYYACDLAGNESIQIMDAKTAKGSGLIEEIINPNGDTTKGKALPFAAGGMAVAVALLAGFGIRKGKRK
jgi:hypothetical protein